MLSSPLPRSPRARDAWLLFACLLASGVASILARQDANWDLGNYHLYNPWALMTGRYGHDLAPAQLQTYHNPLLDVPFYAMVAADWPPRAIAFVMGLPAGVAAFFVLKLAALAFAGITAPLSAIAIACATAIGVTGSNGRAMLGSTMNEWHVSAFIMAALWLVASEHARGRGRLAPVALAGLVVGAATGLKLTAATYAVGIAVALLARRDAIAGARSSMVFGIAVLAGITLTLGPWMAWVHADTGNPLFPYFNDIFRSPLLPPEPIVVRSYGPKSPVQWLALPFVSWNPPRSYVSEMDFRDARLPVLAALLLIAPVVPAIRRARHAPAGPAADRARAATVRFLGLFVVVSFMVWAGLHSIYRYLLAAELVTGILIVALTLRLVPPRARIGALVVLAIVIVATTRPADWGRTAYGSRFLEVQVPAIAPGALIALTGDAPLSHALVRFPPDARHVSLESNIVRARSTTGLRARAAAIVDAHRGPMYQLSLADSTHEDTLAAYGLARTGKPCAEVRSNLQQRPFVLCAVERLAR